METQNDFFLIQVPKGFDIKKLDGVKCDPQRAVEIETQVGRRGIVTTMEIGPHGQKPLDVNLLVKSKTDNQEAVASSLITHYLSISKSIQLKKKSSSSSKLAQRLDNQDPVPMPEGLKQRFKPFGSGLSMPARKKKKKKGMRKRELDESALEDRPDGKRLKMETSSGEQDGVQSDIPPAYVKDRTDSVFEHSQNDSIKSNEEALHNTLSVNSSVVGNHHKKKRKNESGADSVFVNSDKDFIPFNSEGNGPSDTKQTVNGLPISDHKIKDKRKLSSGYQSIDSSITLDESVLSGSDSAERRAKKKKKNSLPLDESVLSGSDSAERKAEKRKRDSSPQDESVLSDSHSAERKAKKRKKDSLSRDESVLSSFDTTERKEEKKKKNSLPLNESVLSDSDSTRKKMKKKKKKSSQPDESILSGSDSAESSERKMKTNSLPLDESLFSSLDSAERKMKKKKKKKKKERESLD